MRTVRGIVAAWVVVAAGCGSPGKGTSESARPDGPALPPAWTEDFKEPALLAATEIRVEGPLGLIAHVATRPDAAHEHVEKTIPEGFLQETTVRAGEEDVEIRAQLDNLVLAATRKLVVLERPGPVDIVVSASGEVYWKNQKTQAEKRGPTLRLEGKVRR